MNPCAPQAPPHCAPEACTRCIQPTEGPVRRPARGSMTMNALPQPLPYGGSLVQEYPA
jgi:hypothetical protein